MEPRRSRLLRIARWGERAALCTETSSLSFPALEGLAARWGSLLLAHGVRSGDSVAALLQPGVAAVAAMLGAYWIGATWVPINPRYRAREVEHVLRDSGAVVVLHSPELVDALPGSPAVRRVADLDVSDQPQAPLANIADDATALLIYTSGTTGTSKGVELSFRAVVDGIDALAELWRFDADDVLSLQLPLFHVHGLCIGVHGALLRGMTMLVHPRFSAAAVVDDVRTRGATVFMGVPTMYVRLVEHLQAHPADGAALQRARLFTAGSAALPADLLQRFEAATGHRILERYGMTETLITLSNPCEGPRRAGAVGLPVPGVEIRVVDDDGAELAHGETGELQVRTIGMMTGYRGRAADTAAAFDGPWFRTGDVVCRDGDGYVRIVGRRSVDIIKTGGFKVAAREIEDVLRTHPIVAEVAVFGVPDPHWGERITAAVVLRGALPDPTAALQAHGAAALADYKKPREVWVMDALPRNAMGKVLKAQLQARGRAFAGTSPRREE